MTRRSGRSVPAALALTALVTATCALVTGCDDNSRGEGSALAEATAADHGGNAVTVDIRIAGGSVTPVNARAEARIGEPVTLVIDSDADDELHIHATPEHTFTVRAGAEQRFTFAVDVPGRVDIELHRANVTVTTIYVRP